MNKETYLLFLKKRLATCPKELSDDIMSDYNDHFIYGEKMGKSDQEIIDSLGNIDDLIMEIEHSYPHIKSANQTSTKTENSDGAIFNYNEIRPKPKEQQPTFSYDDTQSFSKIIGNILSADLRIEEADEFYIEYENSGSAKNQLAIRPYSYVENDTFYFGIKPTSILGSFNSHNSNMSFTIGLPNGFEEIDIQGTSSDLEIISISLDQLRLNITSGDVDCRESNINKVHFKSASSDLNLQAMQCEEIQLFSASGNLSLAEFTCDTLNAKTTSADISTMYARIEVATYQSCSGDIEINDSQIDHCKTETTSGEISINAIFQKLTCTSVSGNLDIECDTCDINCKTTSGDINITLNTDSNIVCDTISGDTALTINNHNGGFQGCTKSLSGTTQIDYDDLDIETQRNGTHVYGNKATSFDLHSTSGDFTIS